MPCNANLGVSYPSGGLVEVACSGGVGTLSTAFGNLSASCRPSRVRGRINGGAWVMATVIPSSFGGTHIAPWTLRNIPGATCDNLSDTLEVEVEVTDQAGAVTWLAGNPVAFNAYCFMTPPPMRMNAAETMEVQLQDLVVPSPLWGAIAGNLVQTEVVKLKRAHRNEEGGIAWRSADGLWTLIADGDQKAQLRLEVDGEVDTGTYEFVFRWGSGDFSVIKGGEFGPVGNNPIAQTLIARGRRDQKGPAMKPRPRGKGKSKSGGKPARKPRRGAKKRRGRR